MSAALHSLILFQRFEVRKSVFQVNGSNQMHDEESFWNKMKIKLKTFVSLEGFLMMLKRH
jgi:hypothetical protein